MLYVTYLWLYIVYIDRLCYYRKRQSAWRKRRSWHIKFDRGAESAKKLEINYISRLNADLRTMNDD